MKIFQREAIKCDLASQVLRSTGELRLRALGLSMLPSLWPGDILSIQSCTFEDVAGAILCCVRGKASSLSIESWENRRIASFSLLKVTDCRDRMVRFPGGTCWVK